MPQKQTLIPLSYATSTIRAILDADETPGIRWNFCVVHMIMQQFEKHGIPIPNTDPRVDSGGSGWAWRSLRNSLGMKTVTQVLFDVSNLDPEHPPGHLHNKTMKWSTLWALDTSLYRPHGHRLTSIKLVRDAERRAIADARERYDLSVASVGL